MELKLKNIYDAQINDSETFDEAIKDFGLNYCKGNSRLKKRKDFALEAIRQYPWNVIHLPEELLEDEDIKEALKEGNSYMFNKYIDPSDAFLNENIVNSVKVQLADVRASLEMEEEIETLDSYTKPEKLRGKDYGKER